MCPQHVCYQRQAELLARLQAVDSGMFVVPQHLPSQTVPLPSNCTPAEPLLKFCLRKKTGFDRQADLNELSFLR